MKAALVTGASSGIGYAIAERLLADGFAVAAATHRRDEETRSAVKRLGEGGQVTWVAGDLSDARVPATLVEETVAAFGRIDALVNNAGLTTAGPALELTAEDFDRLFAIDVRAAFLLTQEAARRMIAQGDGGVVVNVTSIHETTPRPGFSLYAAAKAALGMLTRGLALELGERAIRVNAVAPGAIATERNVEAEALRPEIPLGRAGRPAEIAALVSWLVSEEASYVTGASFLIDGGMAQQVFGRSAG